MNRAPNLREFVSWPPLLAVLLLGLNDHVFKALLHTWWTGKLSDFAGLFYFPLLLTALCRLVWGMFVWLLVKRRRGPGRWLPPLRLWQLIVAAIATGIVFVGINTIPAANELYSRILGAFAQLGIISPPRSTLDFTDLIALPMLLASVLWGRQFAAGTAADFQRGE